MSFMILVMWICRKRAAAARSTPGSAGCSSFRRPCTASATAATTPRRPWASSPACCFPTGHPGQHLLCAFWVVLAAHSAIALGTLCGGWRIVKTMGQKMTKLRPIDGFCAETAAPFSILFLHPPGHPGLHHPHHHRRHHRRRRQQRASRRSAGVTFRIVWAWILTIPGSALISALCLVRHLPAAPAWLKN